MLENNHDSFKKCYYIQRVLIRKESNPQYTKVDSNSNICRGWHTKGIRRFNTLVLIVTRNGNTYESKKKKI